MYSVVHDVPAVQTALIVEVALELVINILYDGLKAVREKKAKINTAVKACN